MEPKEEIKFIERHIAIPIEWFEKFNKEKCKHYILQILEELPDEMWKEYEQIKNYGNNRD